MFASSHAVIQTALSQQDALIIIFFACSTHLLLVPWCVKLQLLTEVFFCVTSEICSHKVCALVKYVLSSSDTSSYFLPWFEGNDANVKGEIQAIYSMIVKDGMCSILLLNYGW